ncbi:MAG: AsmA-like C-terminal region-containing protein [Candidatus Auribacterota bacterium]|jgi:hypothetical protein|nr:AsmA-like C-terminal region-containing protein [Candidatus Auribacterota bacterium]
MRKRKYEKKSKVSSTGKRWIIPSVILAILLILYVAYIFNLNRYKSRFENFLKEAVKAEVDIGSIRLKLFGNLAIKLNNVSIRDTQERDCALTADQILLDINLNDLISKKIVHFPSITIVRPHLKICKDTDGNWQIPGLYDDTASYRDKNSSSRSVSVKSKQLLPSFPSYKFDYSSFYIHELRATDAVIEVISHIRKEAFCLKQADITAVRQFDSQVFDIVAQAQIDHDPKSKIFYEGSLGNPGVDFASSSFSDILEQSQFKGILSVDALSPLDMGALIDIDNLPGFAKDIILYAVCYITGSYKDGFNFRGRMHPTRVPIYKKLDVDFSVFVALPFINVDYLMTRINDAEIIVDGKYDLKSDNGLFYLQTDTLDIDRLGDVLSFIRNVDIKGKGRIFAQVPVYNFVLHPSMTAQLYLSEFTGNFDILAYPLYLQQPTTATLTQRELSFKNASVLYNECPLILDFTYLMGSQQSISIQFNHFSDMQLLDIIALGKPEKESASLQDTPADNTLKQPANSPADSAMKSDKSKKHSGSRIPIYINGPIRDAHLGAVFIDSGYIDSLIEDNRILLKDIDLMMYGGNFKGNGVIKITDSVPSFSIVADVRDIAINDIIADTTSYEHLIEGVFSSAMSFQCTGKTVDDIKDTLVSHGVIKIENGVIHNLPLLKELLNGFSDDSNDKRLRLYGSTVGLKLPPLEEFGFEQETSFTELRCAFEVKKDAMGKNAFHTDDLAIDSPKMKIKLNGSFDFERNLNFTGITTLSEIQTMKLLHKVKELSMLFKVSNEVMEIPFKIKGTIENPEPIPVIRLNTLQNKMEDILHNRLFHSKSEDIQINSKQPELGIDKKIDDIELDEKDLQKIKKLEKKLKKYLE